MPITFIEHKGKKILYSDFSNVRDVKQMMQLIEESDRMYQLYGDNVRHLMNFENAAVSPEFFERAKQLGKKNVERCFKDAFTGITSLKAILIKGYLFFTAASRTAKVFDTVEEAKDWLAQD